MCKINPIFFSRATFIYLIFFCSVSPNLAKTWFNFAHIFFNLLNLFIIWKICALLQKKNVSGETGHLYYLGNGTRYPLGFEPLILWENVIWGMRYTLTTISCHVLCGIGYALQETL